MLSSREQTLFYLVIFFKMRRCAMILITIMSSGSASWMSQRRRN